MYNNSECMLTHSLLDHSPYLGKIINLLFGRLNFPSKSYDVTIQLKPLWQNICIVLFISEDFMKCE